ncbi:hypothetical protein I862_00370 [endosymbiont of Acanthamoeba sp. UWC8]|uniref:hypothetical protein n=1 Tax=endosymbiont of Acanthamoeba sp. UWC8 TaxID=86106 RepID=UPI0004D189E6|nr:hypothetical protein [endosymbiont of Acanthamoeba sp. UWC8]AIF80639.1 hypothetical protein I862_00370 [endosymbiont of Acanthamoeba sp. UWC8]
MKKKEEITIKFEDLKKIFADSKNAFLEIRELIPQLKKTNAEDCYNFLTNKYQLKFCDSLGKEVNNFDNLYNTFKNNLSDKEIVIDALGKESKEDLAKQCLDMFKKEGIYVLEKLSNLDIENLSEYTFQATNELSEFEVLGNEPSLRNHNESLLRSTRSLNFTTEFQAEENDIENSFHSDYKEIKYTTPTSAELLESLSFI